MAGINLGSRSRGNFRTDHFEAPSKMIVLGVQDCENWSGPLLTHKNQKPLADTNHMNRGDVY